jgi:hypothetical protein
MIFRLGLRLALRSGREALVRLLLIASAVAIGVAVLLPVLASLHGFQSASDQRCWECTTGSPDARLTSGSVARAELWNYGEDYYAGQVIRRLDVAALGPRSPVVPGIPRLPLAGEYFASPALVKLLHSVPRDELGDRFPGALVGVIGDAALTGPDDLVVIIGRLPSQVASLPATVRVGAIATISRVNSSTNLYQFGFAMVAIGLVFPLLTLIGTATRLAAARREARFAAFRLVGATPGQVCVIASVDAVIGAVLGTMAGIGIFQALQPAVAHVAITGSRYFPDTVSPTAPGYAAVLLGVPIAAACAAVWSLQRVRISPLAVSRQTTPPAPSALRLVPLLAGLVVFIAVPIVLGGSHQASGNLPGQISGGPNQAELPVLFLGELLVMVGLVLSGSWLTMQGARFVAKSANGPSGLLSARRLADNPKAAFRSVSGLVLAVFVGTAVAGIVPTVNSGMTRAGNGTLNSILRVSFSSPDPGPGTAAPVAGLSPRAGAGLLREVRSYPGAAALPVYGASLAASLPTCMGNYDCAPSAGIVGCHDLRQFPVLGRCAPGIEAVQVKFGFLLSTNNLLSTALPVIGPGTPAASGQPGGLYLDEMLIKTRDPVTLEKIRTLLTSYTAQSGSDNVPQTFGEVSHARAILYDEIEQVTLAVVAVTLFVAGCSLAVAIGGGLLERKRPFTLLRLSGTRTTVLYRVVLLESAVPLTMTAAVAAGAGFGAAASTLRTLSANGLAIALPGHVYFATISGGLAASLAMILATLPLLRRITEPNNVRFE